MRPGGCNLPKLGTNTNRSTAIVRIMIASWVVVISWFSNALAAGQESLTATALRSATLGR